MTAPSLRERIARHVAQRLVTGGRPDGLHAHRQRARPIEQDKLPAVVIYLGTETIERSDLDEASQRTIELRVQCRDVCDTADDRQSPDAALDPLLTWVERTVLKDGTQGGHAQDTRLTRIEWLSAEAAARTYGGAVMVFEVDYVTAGGDPTREEED